MIIKTYDQLFDAEGKYITDSRYQEIHVLDKMLAEAEIPHTMKPFMDGFQICYPVESKLNKVMDAIEHFGSYGNEMDLLEIMGLLTPEEQEFDSVLGNLSAQEVFSRIKTHWDSTQETNNG